MFAHPAKKVFPSRVEEAVGDPIDAPSMRAALSSVRTLFLLNAVSPDEVTEALVAPNLAREADIERMVYLSVDMFADVPHFTAKHMVERMIESLNIRATILHLACFMQNERSVLQVIQGHDVYPMPACSAVVAMIDAREIAEIGVRQFVFGRGMNHRCIGRRSCHRALVSEARDGTVDQVWIGGRQRFIVQTEPLHDAGAEVLDHDVGFLRQLARDALTFSCLKIQDHASLAAVHRRIVGAEARAVRRPVANHVSRRGLDLDHVGTDVRQRSGAHGA
nr:NmrA family NAD(P)-binding protein [Variovorax paradoxus]